MQDTIVGWLVTMQHASFRKLLFDVAFDRRPRIRPQPLHHGRCRRSRDSPSARSSVASLTNAAARTQRFICAPLHPNPQPPRFQVNVAEILTAKHVRIPTATAAHTAHCSCSTHGMRAQVPLLVLICRIQEWGVALEWWHRARSVTSPIRFDGSCLRRHADPHRLLQRFAKCGGKTQACRRVSNP